MKNKQMPAWMLKDHTVEELRSLYINMPFITRNMTFDEYVKEWNRQRKEKSIV